MRHPSELNPGSKAAARKLLYTEQPICKLFCSLWSWENIELFQVLASSLRCQEWLVSCSCIANNWGHWVQQRT